MPAQERMSKKWNSDPYDPNGGSGTEEEAPYVWILPYYIMKYYKLLN